MPGEMQYIHVLAVPVGMADREALKHYKVPAGDCYDLIECEGEKAPRLLTKEPRASFPSLLRSLDDPSANLEPAPDRKSGRVESMSLISARSQRACRRNGGSAEILGMWGPDAAVRDLHPEEIWTVERGEIAQQAGDRSSLLTGGELG